ncbi:hypothetical protein HNR39_002778 [Glaciimonas immobilis]|uniref:Uncharacterized protein n=1 Tax=Glaciimonas immobilis TaxID=728004 RepID=A0A840RVM5_9BURK|nr:hypothetical protein [Glaciimonas immobilis]
MRRGSQISSFAMAGFCAEFRAHHSDVRMGASE